MAWIGVLTLFSEQNFTSMSARNARLVDEINRRVRSDRWFVSIDIIDWKRQPNYKDVGKWLRGTLARVGDPTPNLARDDYPSAVYSSQNVNLAFEFLSRSNSSVSGSGEIVGFGGSSQLRV